MLDEPKTNKQDQPHSSTIDDQGSMGSAGGAATYGDVNAEEEEDMDMDLEEEEVGDFETDAEED